MRNRTKFVGICAATLAMLTLMNVNSGQVVKTSEGNQSNKTVQQQVAETPQGEKSSSENSDNSTTKKVTSNSSNTLTAKNNQFQKDKNVQDSQSSDDALTKEDNKSLNSHNTKDGSSSVNTLVVKRNKSALPNEYRNLFNSFAGQLSKVDGNTIETAYPFNVTIDAPLSKTNKIKWRDDIREEDIARYFNQRVHINKGDNTQKSLLLSTPDLNDRSTGEIGIYDKNGNPLDYIESDTGYGVLLKFNKDDQLDLNIYVNPGVHIGEENIKPNKWYKWQLDDASNNGFLNEYGNSWLNNNGQIDYQKINDYIQDNDDLKKEWNKTFWIDESQNIVYAKTNKKGEWDCPFDVLSYRYKFSTDSDAIDIPKIPEDTVISDKHITNAITITSELDMKPQKIKWTPDLTVNDLVKLADKYAKENWHVYVGKNKFDRGSYSPKLYSPSDLKFGTKSILSPVVANEVVPKDAMVDFLVWVDEGLKPNTWYQWHRDRPIYENVEGNDLPREILDRLSVHKEADGYTIAGLTDNNGSLPILRTHKDSNGGYEIVPLGYRNKVLAVFTVTTDSNATDISDLITKPTTPVTVPTIKPIDGEEGYYYKPSEATISDNNGSSHGTGDEQTDSGNDTTRDKNDNLDVHSSFKPLMLKHNAFIYNKKGKLVKTKEHLFVVWKAFKNFEPKDNGKVYIIKGKKFYRVGKDHYIKVANTTTRPKTKKFTGLGIVKGHRKVRLYDLNGKFAKRYVASGKRLEFSHKRLIRNRLCYQIAGLNLWIRASRVKTSKNRN